MIRQIDVHPLSGNLAKYHNHHLEYREVVRRRVQEELVVLGTFGTVIVDFAPEMLLILEMRASLEKPIVGFVL
jgi:hypothetical protein